MLRPRSLLGLAVIWLATFAAATHGQLPERWAMPDETLGDRMLSEYFKLRTAEMRDACLADVHTLDDWLQQKEARRAELFDMLGLHPLPERSDLQPVVTGTVAGDGYTVERLHFQSLPGLYVTGNLYLPDDLGKPAPTVLYVCGHARAKEGDVSFGNKTAYQHHGVWFARNGYVCLTIDTLQLGEIEGKHHGTYRLDQWWWNARGYTPAGVEAWNCIRSLDYLETRPEVDASRFGVTGRSGGGAYSWWVAALDERIKVAAPVAGVTDLQNHVVDGCVEGHCDCMFFVNSRRWDYAMLPALAAPRPLLIVNTDNDDIFPLDGVYRIYEKTRKLYALHDAAENLGLQISEGPHKDTQNLQVAVGNWFNRHLKGDEDAGNVENVGVKPHPPAELRVFDELPADEINTSIEETFVAQDSGDDLDADAAAAWMREHCFAAWPSDPPPLDVELVLSQEKGGVLIQVHEFTSQEPFRLRMYSFRPLGVVPKQRRFHVLDTNPDDPSPTLIRAIEDDGTLDDLMWDDDKIAEITKWLRIEEGAPVIATFFFPRGTGPYAFSGDERKQIQTRRRFQLLGETLHGQQAYDVVRALAALEQIGLDGDEETPLDVFASDSTSGVAAAALLFQPLDKVEKLVFHGAPMDFRGGPIFLNFAKRFDAEQLFRHAATRLGDGIQSDGFPNFMP